MIAVDTNILVYAHREDSEWHLAADQCLTELAEAGTPWAIPWPCIHEFFAIVTHPRIYAPPTPSADASAQIDCWLESPTLHLLGEGLGYWEVLSSLLETSRVKGPQVHDARIAALCKLHGVATLWTADRDFNRFQDLASTNPLVSLQ
ncbi:TA system VapC family ribonuclease toxin [Acaryochloris sp. CCMEE 5410]|uniref:TA system VapC family ribonuclease toxin n=1 Tax=Acaryochloris sp. CCMEE 5410 TaxID=310037 RepID=UPI0002484F95|nr:TA system VapC family ribonuclease toxin [Acaryochloris sp. CCMEE 5410]KAI9133579.1 PIN domain-containing protein [Acaryochloris sp. CCMEE 5410]